MYLAKGIIRTLKAGGGSGNIPKVIFNMYFSLEDGNENCIERLYKASEVSEFIKNNKNVKEIFLFCDDEVVASWLSENFLSNYKQI